MGVAAAPHHGATDLAGRVDRRRRIHVRDVGAPDVDVVHRRQVVARVKGGDAEVGERKAPAL